MTACQADVCHHPEGPEAHEDRGVWQLVPWSGRTLHRRCAGKEHTGAPGPDHPPPVERAFADAVTPAEAWALQQRLYTEQLAAQNAEILRRGREAEEAAAT